MPDYSKGQKNAEYIFYYSTDSNKNQSNSNDTLELIRIFAGFFTIFNTLIPISIMISSEIIKTFQVNLIEKDSEMKKDQEDQFRIFSSKLHEDLGNVKYIFSDKTGTLTKNEMIFRACNIFCKTFGEIEEENNNNIEEMNMNLNQKMSIQFNEKGKKKSILSNTFNKYLIQQAVKEGGILNIQNLENSPIKNMGEACREFFFNISLNHNVLVELEEEEIHDFKKKENLSIGKNKKSVTVKPGKTTIMPIIEKFEDKSKTINEINEFENLKYQGSNPDEVVLVTAASEIGVSFLNKNKEYLHINFFNEHLKFKILQKFEFSSERKRSSVIVEDDLGIIKIYVKGSDEKILSEVNINNFSKEFLLKDTKDEIDSFARIGLRTLCFAYKEIKKQDYLIWEEEFNKLKQECIIDKSKNSLLEKFISKIEEDLILLGATALEDKLQDNVKIDLQEFIEGGISVWMITGDKLDTAESIGHSCRLFNDDTEVFKIKSSDKKTTK
jgi:phospholipid-translocating ATPase